MCCGRPGVRENGEPYCDDYIDDLWRAYEQKMWESYCQEMEASLAAEAAASHQHPFEIEAENLHNNYMRGWITEREYNRGMRNIYGG